MAGKKGNKAHANKTSFTSEQMEGNNNAESWDLVKSTVVFESAFEMSKKDNIYFIGTIAKKLDISRHTFTYLCDKFPVLNAIKQKIDSNIENNLFIGGLTDNDVNSTVSIFGLKNNHNWKDKREVESSITIDQDLSKLTTEEIILRAKAISKLNE